LNETVRVMTTQMREFTLEELARYDGRDGRRAFVAYDGKVYDVSESFLWKDGKHQVIHPAGADLSGALEQAPHGAEFFEKVALVGVLIGGEGR
jgi:predicted heme/steroid binding protein